jgi:flavin reductase (DIM6/NTAB) family NADH-FMN oxidoreductase RutF
VPQIETNVSVSHGIVLHHRLVNLVSSSAISKMIITSIAFPSGVQESDEAGLTLVASERVAVPRIIESPVSIECVLAQEVTLDHEFNLVLGRVLRRRSETTLRAMCKHPDSMSVGICSRTADDER